MGDCCSGAGHDVTFIGRQPHVDAINAHGLLLDTKTFNGRLPAKAATDATALASPDLVLVCVKSADTEQAGRSLAGRLQPETSVLACRTASTMRRVLPRSSAMPSFPSSSMSAARWPDPATSGITAVATSPSAGLPRAKRWRKRLRPPASRITIADDIDKTLWSKLIINCAFNALSAVADISYGPMLEVEGTRDVVTRAVQEATTVARACGVSISDDLLAHILNIPAIMPNQMSSTAQDLARGKPSEIDFLNGHVVRKGAELGIPTPTNHALQVMVKLTERGKAMSAQRR